MSTWIEHFLLNSLLSQMRSHNIFQLIDLHRKKFLVLGFWFDCPLYKLLPYYTNNIIFLLHSSVLKAISKFTGTPIPFS